MSGEKKYHVFKEDAMLYSDILDEYYPLLNKDVVNLLNEQSNKLDEQKTRIYWLEKKEKAINDKARVLLNYFNYLYKKELMERNLLKKDYDLEARIQSRKNYLWVCKLIFFELGLLEPETEEIKKIGD